MTGGAFAASVVLSVVAAAVLGAGNAALPPGTSAKYHISDRVIHLKHGRLHLPEDESDVDVDGHLRYKWLEDDILKMEDDYGGDDDEDEEAAENMIKLPGGCELTEDQFEELESFKKETRYVKKCYCEQGGVYCQLSKNFLRGDAAT